MSNRLGYTWWPKDWTSSQSVQSLDIVERGVYRELIDMVMIKEEPIKVNTVLWARLWRMEAEHLSTVLSTLETLELIEWQEGKIWIPSVEARLEKTLKKRTAARANGAKGGRPTKPETTQEKPNKNPVGLQLKQKHKQKQKQKPKQQHKSEKSAVEVAVDQIKNDRIWIESLCMTHSIDMQQVEIAFAQFPDHIVAHGKESVATDDNTKELKYYFSNYIRKAKANGNLTKPANIVF